MVQFTSFHYFLTVITSLYFTGEFLFGLLKVGWHFEINIHGVIGLCIPILLWIAFLLSPCVTRKVMNWKTVSKIHAILGLMVLFLIIIQIVYGYLFFEG